MITNAQGQRLMQLIGNHVAAAIDNSWKGGGHPEDAPYIEQDYNDTKAELAIYVAGLVVENTDESNISHADLYAALRAMHWNDGKLTVIKAKDAPLGTVTYSGDMLDTAIVRATSGGEG